MAPPAEGEAAPAARSLRRTLTRNISEVSMVTVTIPPPIRPSHFLGRALFTLRMFASAEEAEDTLHLSTLTADEHSLHALSASSREFVPALAELRSKAIDREILEPLARESLAKTAVAGGDDSEGEATDYGFNIDDDSSGEEDAGEEAKRKQAREAPLVLPPGWRAERMLIGGKNVLQFVDPRGMRYRNESLAKAAVAQERIKANMSRSLMSKFAAKFKDSAAATAATAAAAPVDVAMKSVEESDGDVQMNAEKRLRAA